MKSFLDELRIIPPMIWLVALVVAGGALYLLTAILRYPRSGLGFNDITIISGVFTLLVFCWVLLMAYINADARRRGMRHVLWTMLAIFIPNGIGAILYFVLRDSLLIPCPKCGTSGRAGFIFCPQCGWELSLSCPTCKRAMEPGWNRCAYCGTELGH